MKSASNLSSSNTSSQTAIAFLLSERRIVWHHQHLGVVDHPAEISVPDHFLLAYVELLHYRTHGLMDGCDEVLLGSSGWRDSNNLVVVAASVHRGGIAGGGTGITLVLVVVLLTLLPSTHNHQGITVFEAQHRGQPRHDRLEGGERVEGEGLRVEADEATDVLAEDVDLLVHGHCGE